MYVSVWISSGDMGENDEFDDLDHSLACVSEAPGFEPAPL